MNYKARNDIVLLEKIDAPPTPSGIVLPGDDSAILVHFKVLKVGLSVTDLKSGDIVLAEDAMQPLSKANRKVGLLNQKYIHLIKES